jgi:hypothetical protein
MASNDRTFLKPTVLHTCVAKSSSTLDLDTAIGIELVLKVASSDTSQRWRKKKKKKKIKKIPVLLSTDSACGPLQSKGTQYTGQGRRKRSTVKTKN